jgi:hypothetical protein
MGKDKGIGGVRLPVHRNAAQAERERGLKRAQNFRGAGTSGAAVGDDADPVAARNLPTREIADVPEQAADGCAQHVQDVQWLHRP